MGLRVLNFAGKESTERASQETVRKGLASLLAVLRQYLDKEIEVERISRVAVLLIKSGANANNFVFQEIAARCSREQKSDGGWIGVEDSFWSVAFLKEFNCYFQEYERGLDWLKAQKLKNAAWGKTTRDTGRIPITGALLYLLPELSSNASFEWLEREWKREFLLNPKLTYKGAFSLMALKSNGYQFLDGNLFDKTISWLVTQQNDDYGWGPSKSHPVGSTPFCTGVVLTGLLQYPDRVNRSVIVNGLKWIQKNQLKDGLWPDHYIEEGSAWSFYALTEGYKFLKGKR